MALPIHIPDLFTGTVVEWERLEFKEGWNPEAALHTLCAFANDLHNWGGGYLVIGVAERDGRPVLPPAGLSPGQIDRIQKQMLEVAHRIVPAYHPIPEPYLIEGRHVLVLWAPGGQNRPYKAPVSLAKGERATGTSSDAGRPQSGPGTRLKPSCCNWRPTCRSTTACGTMPSFPTSPSA